MTDQFPPNPRPDVKRHPLNQREETPAAQPKKEIEKVVTGEVTLRKKPWSERISDKVNSGGVVGYMLGDVMMPMLRGAVVEAFAGGLERAIYGDVRPGGRPVYRPGAGVGPIPGRTQYHQPSHIRGGGQMPEPRRLAPRHEEWRDVVVATQAEAREVIDRLWDLCQRYPAATVADYYEMLGQSAQFTDERRGWTADTMQYATIKRDRAGWLIVLPDPEPIVS